MIKFDVSADINRVVIETKTEIINELMDSGFNRSEAILQFQGDTQLIVQMRQEKNDNVKHLRKRVTEIKESYLNKVHNASHYPELEDAIVRAIIESDDIFAPLKQDAIYNPLTVGKFRVNNRILGNLQNTPYWSYICAEMYQVSIEAVNQLREANDYKNTRQIYYFLDGEKVGNKVLGRNESVEEIVLPEGYTRETFLLKAKEQQQQKLLKAA